MDIPEIKIAKVGTYIRDEKPSLVPVACALRDMLDDVIQGTGEAAGIRNLLEYAAQNMIIENDPRKAGKIAFPRERVTTCAHSCSQHAELMNISLWGGLPEELKELVFARFPWPQIYRLRILSKGWNQKMRSAKDSEFMRACVNAQPKLFALLAPGDSPGSFGVNMFDTTSNRWHTFETSMEHDPKYGEIQAVSASDGGLVCFISKVKSKSKKIPLLVFVCNPLTQVWKRLPPLYGLVQQKIMVQLIMDRETKYYRVIVVGHCKGPKVGNLVNIFHSETGQWTKADGSSSSGEVVYGYLYNFNEQAYFNSSRFPPVPCSYSFVDGRVLEIDTNFPGNYAHESDLVKDHLFRLKDLETGAPPRIQPGLVRVLPTHCIEEYQAENCGASWTHLKDYHFTRLPITPEIQPDDMWWFTDFRVCKDFLLLFVFNEREEAKRREFLWLYDLSGNEWHELPMMPGGNHLFHAQKQMCELRFDSVP